MEDPMEERMKPFAALLFLAAFACAADAEAQDAERFRKLVERVEKEIRESHLRLREEIRELVRAELARIPGAPAPSAPAPSVRRVTLGISAGDLTEDDRRRAGVDGGVKVEAARGGAAAAGIRPGDILVALDGQPVTEDRLPDLLSARKPGEVVSVTFVRGGKKETVKVTLGERRD
jgi:S1-C subfamily serine protease